MGSGVRLYAHSASTATGVRHGFADHLRSTARLAEAFAAPFGAGAFTLGLFHDAGKAECSWQQRLLERELAGGGRVGGRHWELGAKLLAAMAVLGHHDGLSCVAELARLLDLVTVDEQITRERFLSAVPEAAKVLTGGSLLPKKWQDWSVLDMGIRLVFSALVDADFLDTAAHFRGDPALAVPDGIDWCAVVDRFENARAGLLRDRVAQRGDSPIDGTVRRCMSWSWGRLGFGRACIGCADGFWQDHHRCGACGYSW